MKKISVLGAGNMGGAIAIGLARAGYSVTVSNPGIGKLDALRERCSSIEVTQDNIAAVAGADVVFIATRPAQCIPVIEEVAEALKPGALVVTLAPQYKLEDIKLPEGCHSARMMPNTAIAYGASMTFVTFSTGVPDGLASQFCAMIANIGEVAVIDESLFGAATALCSCGLAYALRYVRAATEGAVAMGFKPDDAVRYLSATLRGAVCMLDAGGEHPEELIDRVTTPGGTTIRGLLAMEKAGFSNAVIQGLLASSHE